MDSTDELNSDVHLLDNTPYAKCGAMTGAGTEEPTDVTCEACKKAAGL